MKILRIITILSFLFCSFSVRAQEPKACVEKEICFAVEAQNAKHYLLKLKNNTAHIMTVLIKPYGLEHIIGAHNYPLPLILQPYQNITRNVYFKTPIVKGFRVGYQWLYGSYFTKDYNYEYALPYQHGGRYQVGQGMDTNETHKGSHKYAIDWNMKEGTTITAARSGKVVKIEDKFTEAGTDKSFLKKANFIKILHNDGSIATYAHLKHQGVLVKNGAFVNRGQVIGISGNTGFSTGPHLHFHIATPFVEEKLIKTDSILKEKTLPFKFRSCQLNNSFVPQLGIKYKSC